jgi:zinc and cadmium transporter
MTTAFSTITAVLLVSLISLVGIFTFSLNKKIIGRCLLFFVSFSTGALLGDVFIHIIPEIAENEAFFTNALLLILAGIVFSFVIEKMIHWRHCHVMPTQEEHHDHHHNVGLMNLLGDGVHNFIDGALIAGSFLVSIEIGIATTIAVALHEIPQEIGDFAILLYSGFSRKKALLFNLLSALTALVGAGIVLAFGKSLPLIGSYILPLAAGNFLYIAGSDLIPELHKETRLKQAVIQLVCMVSGIGIMYALTVME